MYVDASPFTLCSAIRHVISPYQVCKGMAHFMRSSTNKDSNEDTIVCPHYFLNVRR